MARIGSRGLLLCAVLGCAVFLGDTRRRQVNRIPRSQAATSTRTGADTALVRCRPSATARTRVLRSRFNPTAITTGRAGTSILRGNRRPTTCFGAPMPRWPRCSIGQRPPSTHRFIFIGPRVQPWTLSSCGTPRINGNPLKPCPCGVGHWESRVPRCSPPRSAGMSTEKIGDSTSSPSESKS